jgi:type IV pilus assembly protein PilC
VVAALVILEQQTDDKFLAEVVHDLRADVEGGLLLSQALVRHPKVFTRLYVSMVEAGEAAGILDQVLDRVAFQIERETAIKRRVKGAMMYPTMVLCFATLVLAGMLMFLVPVFTGIFKDLGGQLPTLTQYVVTASDFLKNDWYIIFPLLIGGFFGFKRWKKTPTGQAKWDAFTLRIPMKIGDVVQKVCIARWSRTLSSLTSAGVPIMQALEITGRTAGNAVIDEAMTNVIASVKAGGTISEPLRMSKAFPPMVAHMVGVGEETGALDTMLSKLAEFYEDEVAAAIKALTSILEPAMIILVGGIVGVIVISMYLPLFNVYNQIH